MTGYRSPRRAAPTLSCIPAVVKKMFLLSGAMLRRGHAGNRCYGPGEYSGEGLYWRDGKSGICYHVHAVETEECEVQGNDLGTNWCKSTLAWLVRAPAIISCQFNAVTDDTAQVAGSVSFTRHARNGVHHLDSLRPDTAGYKATDTSRSAVQAGDHQRAATALARLDSILKVRGWKPRRESGAHWYSRRYRRPVILWEEPVHATELRGEDGSAVPRRHHRSNYLNRSGTRRSSNSHKTRTEAEAGCRYQQIYGGLWMPGSRCSARLPLAILKGCLEPVEDSAC
jgi:hypothetical protein